MVNSQIADVDTAGGGGGDATSTTAAASSAAAPRRVAIVGGGVSGLAAAWHLLQQQNEKDGKMIDVELFEAEDRLGGHAYTINKIGKDQVDIDVGFMVFNDSNYPNMTRWFQAMNNTTQKNAEVMSDKIQEENSDMSLSVSLDHGTTIEWNSDGINGIFARRKQLIEPKFYSLISDMLRFHKEAPKLLLLAKDDPRKHVTTGQYLRTHGYNQSFAMYYLLPMMAALWSASMEDVLNFPACELIGFLCNHKMLQLVNRPQVKLLCFGFFGGVGVSLASLKCVCDTERRIFGRRVVSMSWIFADLTCAFVSLFRFPWFVLVENGIKSITDVYVEDEGITWKTWTRIDTDCFYE